MRLITEICISQMIGIDMAPEHFNEKTREHCSPEHSEHGYSKVAVIVRSEKPVYTIENTARFISPF